MWEREREREREREIKIMWMQQTSPKEVQMQVWPSGGDPPRTVQASKLLIIQTNGICIDQKWCWKMKQNSLG